ncbi:Protein of unknown function (DUF1566) [Rheinheimera sp. A13L]|uniref:InlB B-repeat-containing protein n=1 Tax=Rheinheimera sp. A13L TaxID=506534 RepID=UPI0002124A65|nr:choice-of-anchor U domain-containing protein [Rheinheimera sp. A13L]EGM77659.1 Protein of unknown function (DUF1566) [Rheinheimera sp. A13L]
MRLLPSLAASLLALTLTGCLNDDGTPTYTVSTNVGQGGTLSSATTMAKAGEVIEFDILPEDNHRLSTIEGCGGTLDGSVFTTAPLSQNCTVSVSFIALTVELPDSEQNPEVDASIAVDPDANYGFVPGSVRFTPTTGPEANLPAPLPEGVTPSSSLLEFQVQLQNPGDTATITITYDEPIGLGHRPMKYGPATPGAEPSWYELPAEMFEYVADGKSILVTITDGELGDSDGERNGVINDPVILTKSGAQINVVYTGEYGDQLYGLVSNFNSPLTGAPAGAKGLFFAYGESVEEGSFWSKAKLPKVSISNPESTFIGIGCELKVGQLVSIPLISGGAVNLVNVEILSISNNQSCTIIANDFRTHQVTTSAKNGVTFTPEARTIHRDLFADFTISNTGPFTLSGISGCEGAVLNPEKTFVRINNVKQDCTLTPVFQKIRVTATTGAGGTITPATQDVESLSTTTFTVQPNAGFQIASVQGCSGTLSGSTYTTGSITEACAVTASFEPITYTLTAAATTNGSIALPSPAVVGQGGALNFTVTPNTGYEISSVTGSGCSPVFVAASGTGATYSTGVVTQNCQVSASFSGVQIPVSVSAAAGGTIQLSPNNATSVPYGSSAYVIVNANIGNEIASVLGCGIDFKRTADEKVSARVFNSPSITSACSIAATFSGIVFDMKATQSEGGTVVVETPTVPYNQQARFSITPNDGYSVSRDSISGCAGTLEGNIFTTEPLTSACSLYVEFKVNSYEVTVSQQGEGTATLLGNPAKHGQPVVLTVVPATGYRFASASGCGGFTKFDLGDNSYISAPITSACAVEVVFERIQHIVLALFDSRKGNVTPLLQTVNYGDTASFTINPNPGFTFSAEQIAGCEGAGGTLDGNVFTTSPIIGPRCEVFIDFELEQYALTATAENGTVVSGTPAEVTYGGSHTFELAANEGYSFDRVEYSPNVAACAGTLSGTSYTVDPVAQSCSYAFYFSQNTYTISTAADQGGSWSPASFEFTHGQEAKEFTLTVPDGYEVNSVTGCAHTEVSETVYSVAGITADCTLSATLQLQVEAPSINTVQAGNAMVTLSWSSVTNADSYKVYYAKESIETVANYASLDGGNVASFDATVGSVMELTNGTEYFFRVTTVQGGFESEGSSEVSATPVGVATAADGMNDTGVTQCASTVSASAACPNTGAPRQDAEFGRDADLAGNILTKQGGGVGSLDLTKLGANGVALAIQSQAWDLAGNEVAGTQWSCVKDNVTGLVWDSKVDDVSNYRHGGNIYVWYNSTATENGGNSGLECSESCDTQSYVAALNTNAHCGFTNWRLPTMQEMYDLFGSEHQQDTHYFPHLLPLAPYWTSNTVSSLTTDVFCVIPGAVPGVSQCAKLDVGFVMPVRSAQ